MPKVVKAERDAAQLAEVAEISRTRPATVVRLYKGKQQQDAVEQFQRDAQEMARHGYVPASQSWAAGQWGCGAFLFAAITAILLIGILIFIYLVVVKPEGTLTVTYTLTEPTGVSQQSTVGGEHASQQQAPTTTPAQPPLAPAANVRPVSERLAELDRAKWDNLITEEEYLAKRQEILDQF